MSDFYASGEFLDRNYLFTKYYSLISVITLQASTVEYMANKLKNYSGFGIESQVSYLRTYYARLRDYKEDIRTEFSSLLKIIDNINDNERKAVAFLEGQTDVSFSDYTYAAENNIYTQAAEKKDKEKTVHMTHDDFGKLMNEFKYYSQNDPIADGYYKMWKRLYDGNVDLDISADLYRNVREAYYTFMERSKGDYYYSAISTFGWETATSVTGLLADGELSLDSVSGALGINDKKTVSKDKKGNTTTKSDVGSSPSLDLNLLNAKAEGKGYAMQIEIAGRYNGETELYRITLDNVQLTAQAKTDLNTDSITNVIKQILDKKMTGDEISNHLQKVGIAFDGSVSALKIESQLTKRIYGDTFYYDNIDYTFGTLSAKVSVGNDGFEAKAGATLAEVSVTQGIKTNDKNYGITAGAKAGVEAGISAKNGKYKADVGSFSLGFEHGDGFGRYVWDDSI